MQRVDYFSRGVTEVYKELTAYSEYRDLTVEKNILLVYPFASLFFVSPKHPEIATAIKQGFDNAYEDKSFLEYFENHKTIKLVFSNLQIFRRRTIYINNPFMTQETLDIPSKYWLIPPRP